MIPKQNSETGFSPFLKPADLTKGTTVMIKTEFKAPENPKIQSFLIADVLKVDGSTHTLGINATTYRSIAGVYGVDTADWVGKELEFLGMKPLGKGKGWLWVAYEKTK